MIYLACFLLSTLFAFFATKVQSRWRLILFSFLSILLPVLLAGLRDISIGIDTSNYYDMTRYWATASTVDSVEEYMAFYLPKGYGEVLFAVLVGVMGQIGNYNLFLFVTHAIIITCVYVGAFRLRKHAQPWLVMLLFYLAFYSHSLNVMRQYLALSVAFVFLQDLLEKKYLRYCIGVAIATMFHISGFLSIGLLVIHVLLNLDFRPVLPRFAPSMRNRKLFIFVAVALLVLVFNPLVRLMISEGLLHKKYLYYVKSPFTGYNLLVTLFLLVEMVPLVLLRNNLKGRTPEFDFFFTTSVVYLILYQITAFVTYGKRIAACCSFANLVTLAILTQGLGEEISVITPRWMGSKKITLLRFPRFFDEKKRRILGTVLVIGAVAFYWAYVYVYRNSSETMPYRFFFQ